MKMILIFIAPKVKQKKKVKKSEWSSKCVLLSDFVNKFVLQTSHKFKNVQPNEEDEIENTMNFLLSISFISYIAGFRKAPVVFALASAIKLTW